MGMFGDLLFNFSQCSQSQQTHAYIVSLRTGFKYFHVNKRHQKNLYQLKKFVEQETKSPGFIRE
jgi:hypothetical protein